MTVMTTQPPLPLIPTGATEIGAAAAMIEDDDGGRVFVHGNLSFAWDAGDTAGRRFAAVSLMRIKAATQVQVATAFDTSPLTVWRWAQALSAAGVSALVPHRKGPRRASKLTPEVIATITVLREQGLSLRAIGEWVAVSEASVRRALSDTDTETETETETDDPTTVSDTKSEPETGAGTHPEPVGRPEPVAEPELGSVSGGALTGGRARWKLASALNFHPHPPMLRHAYDRITATRRSRHKRPKIHTRHTDQTAKLERAWSAHNSDRRVSQRR